VDCAVDRNGVVQGLSAKSCAVEDLCKLCWRKSGVVQVVKPDVVRKF
jgi:hypothetical protein